MHLDLTEEETAALLKELDGLIDGDRYFLSSRIKTLRATRAASRAAATTAQAVRATAGDSAGAAVWRRVTDAIGQLENTTPSDHCTDRGHDPLLTPHLQGWVGHEDRFSHRR